MKQTPINLTVKLFFFPSLINDLRISVIGYQNLSEEAGVQFFLNWRKRETLKRRMSLNKVSGRKD